MSDPFLRYTFVDDKLDQPTFSSAGSEHNVDSRFSQRTSYFHPGYESSPTTSSTSFVLRRHVPPQHEWTASTPTYRSTPAAPSDPPPSHPPLTLRSSVQIPFHTSGISLPHSSHATSFSASPLISENPTSVAMPIPSRHTQYGGSGLMDAHRCHYGASLDCASHGNYMVQYPGAVASSFIPTPIVPIFLGPGPSNYMDPQVFHSDPTRQRSPGRPSTALQNLSPPNYDYCLSPSGSSGSELVPFSSPSFPFSAVGSHSLPVSPSSPPGMSNPIQPQPITTTSHSEQAPPLTFTVPLSAVEFPQNSMLIFGDMPFFQCGWGTCGIWITSDKDAIKDHLSRVHHVILKGTASADSAHCEWSGCSSTPQRSGLVRHFHTHLGLKWLCSVCSGAYTRHDSVGYHARREPRCHLAQAVSHPSAAAYKARINRDNTVTLTKILKP